MSKEKTEELSKKVKSLSLEELDNIAGGGAVIGDLYGECEEYRTQCLSYMVGTGIDICNKVSCPADGSTYFDPNTAKFEDPEVEKAFRNAVKGFADSTVSTLMEALKK